MCKLHRKIKTNKKIIKLLAFCIIFLIISFLGILSNTVVKYLYIEEQKRNGEAIILKFPIYEEYIIKDNKIRYVTPLQFALSRPLYFFGDWIKAPKIYIQYCNFTTAIYEKIFNVKTGKMFDLNNSDEVYCSIGDLLQDIGLILAIIFYILTVYEIVALNYVKSAVPK